MTLSVAVPDDLRVLSLAFNIQYVYDIIRWLVFEYCARHQPLVRRPTHYGSHNDLMIAANLRTDEHRTECLGKHDRHHQQQLPWVLSFGLVHTCAFDNLGRATRLCGALGACNFVTGKTRCRQWLCRHSTQAPPTHERTENSHSNYLGAVFIISALLVAYCALVLVHNYSARSFEKNEVCKHWRAWRS